MDRRELVVEEALKEAEQMKGSGNNAVAKFARRAGQRKRKPQLDESVWESIVPAPGDGRGVGDWTLRASRNDSRILR